MSCFFADICDIITVMKRILLMLIALLMLTSCTASYAEVAPAETPAVSPSPAASPSPTPAPTPEPTEEIYEGQLIAEDALQFLGYKYVYGAQNPERGFDCSGLVYYVYKNHGYRLMRVAEDQSHQGELVEKQEDMLPGDLLCFKKGNYCGHIGIYIGDNKFVHATDAYGEVVVTEVDEYTKRYSLEIRRIIGNMEKKTPEQIEKEELEFLALLEEAEKAKAAMVTPSPLPTPEGQKPKSDTDKPIYVVPTDPPKEPEATDTTDTDDSGEQSESADPAPPADQPQATDPPSSGGGEDPAPPQDPQPEPSQGEPAAQTDSQEAGSDNPEAA